MQDEIMFSKLDYRVKAAFGEPMTFECWLKNEWHKSYDMSAALCRLDLDALTFPLAGQSTTPPKIGS